jgi:hypothetical protein
MRLISEVPLGAHLSGGLDSSIIVALMAELSNAPVKTFSVGFEEEAFSELEYARAVAQRYSTDHHEFILKYGDIPATLETITYHFGEPFADASAIPLYHISKMTREHVTVVINGDGGDEDFAGYQRYWLDPLANTYLRAPQFLTRELVPSLTRLLPDASDRPVGQSLANGLKRLDQLLKLIRAPAFCAGVPISRHVNVQNYGNGNFHSRQIMHNVGLPKNLIPLKVHSSIKLFTPICIPISPVICSSKQIGWRWQPPLNRARLSSITKWWNGPRVSPTGSKSAAGAGSIC